MNTSVVKKKKNNLHELNWEANLLGVVNFHCLQMSLVMSMPFIFSDENVPYSSYFLFFGMMLFLSNQGP